MKRTKTGIFFNTLSTIYLLNRYNIDKTLKKNLPKKQKNCQKSKKTAKKSKKLPKSAKKLPLLNISFLTSNIIDIRIFKPKGV